MNIALFPLSVAIPIGGNNKAGGVPIEDPVERKSLPRDITERDEKCKKTLKQYGL